jgi:hypothetical protein
VTRVPLLLAERYPVMQAARVRRGFSLLDLRIYTVSKNSDQWVSIKKRNHVHEVKI